ncbi:DUF3987 domain-containing protein [Anaerospora hongkongensis]|uniref:DUF3987 domain-containing protein n=1 Tax=Anaerospora hongkongensis TaxID=244830 RepID=UPI0028A06638|nr:DUF3987 domain-containing protein [Anaerospora hongkongensis]
MSQHSMRDFIKALPEADRDEIRKFSTSKVLLVNGIFKPEGTQLEEEDDAVPWPDDLDSGAFHGLAGDVVQAIMPHSEADRAAVLINFLVGFGNLIDKTAHFIADRPHYCNMFTLLVGGTSSGKKGTSWSHIKQLFSLVDEYWTNEKTPTGLSSGEGVIWAVRDPIEKDVYDKKTGETNRIIEDAGIDDKRLLLIESEFSRVLKVMQRDGSTVSALLRQIWDSDAILQSLTKTAKGKATDAHISLIGHITKEELLKLLNETEVYNGLMNRFLFCCCRQSKSLPLPKTMSMDVLKALADKVNEAVAYAGKVNSVDMSEDAREMWCEVYKSLDTQKAGIVGSALVRAVPIVRRLAMIYALLDRKNVVEIEHLEAALAVWERSEQSVRFIFGESQVDSEQRKICTGILTCLQSGEKSSTDLIRYFKNHVVVKKINAALGSLSADGKIAYREEKANNNKSVMLWRLVK